MALAKISLSVCNVILRLPIFWLLLAGFLLRLKAYFSIDLFNPDGIIYIQDAQHVLYNGLGALGDCYGVSNIYPLLIAIVFPVFYDWEITGKVISFFFGWLAIIPMYYIFRHFFSVGWATVIAFFFAANPTFVNLSVDVMRESGFIFFSASAISLVLVAENRRAHWLHYFLAGVCFIMAATFRIEALALLFASVVFFIISGWRSGLARSLYIILPCILLLGALLVYGGVSGRSVVNLPSQYERVSEFLGSYSLIRSDLKAFAENPPANFSFPYFWKDMSTIVAWTALGIELHWLAKAMFEPVVLFFLFGLAAVKRETPKDKKLQLIVVLAAVAFAALYVQVVTVWWLDARMMALFLLPGYVIIGFGLIRMRQVLERKFSRHGGSMFIFLAVLVALSSVVKIMKDRPKNKQVYQEIGMAIQHDSVNPQKGIKVGGSIEYMRFIDYYANSRVEVAWCSSVQRLWEHSGKQNGELQFQSQKLDYLVWSSRSDRAEKLEYFERQFVRLGEWNSFSDGDLKLYRVYLKE